MMDRDWDVSVVVDRLDETDDREIIGIAWDESFLQECRPAGEFPFGKACPRS
jgi:hypothetical protein